jgi:hypothetical protein
MGVLMRNVSSCTAVSNFWAGGSRVSAGQRVSIAASIAVFLLQFFNSSTEITEITLTFP